MTKYGWVFILSTFANVSHSRPAIRTIVEKSISFTLAWRNCNSWKSTTGIKTSVRVKGKPKKMWLTCQHNNKCYQESLKNSSKKPQIFLNINLGNQKKNKHMKFYHLFLHLIQITHLYITPWISFKSLREIMFLDLKAWDLFIVSNNQLTLRNCWLKWNIAMKK